MARFYSRPLQKDGHCGPGSTFNYTKILRRELPSFLKKHGIKSMVDAPCGYFEWMNSVQFEEGFKYIGADIVPNIIAYNKQDFPDKYFLVSDISEDKLPDADLLFVRDCLFHFNNEYKRKFFQNFLANNFKFLLTSNHPKCTVNNEVHEFNGCHFEQINWTLSPWNFPQPIDSILDWPEEGSEIYPYRTMVLYSKDEIQTILS